GRSAPLTGIVLGDLIRYVLAAAVLFATGYLLGVPCRDRCAVGGGGGRAGDRAGLRDGVDQRPHRGADQGGGRRPDGRVPRDLPAGVRDGHGRPRGHTAGLAAGVGQGQPGQRRRGGLARAADRRARRRRGDDDAAVVGGVPRRVLPAGRVRLPAPG